VHATGRTVSIYTDLRVRRRPIKRPHSAPTTSAKGDDLGELDARHAQPDVEEGRLLLVATARAPVVELALDPLEPEPVPPELLLAPP
jgi:hypothetical protein